MIMQDNEKKPALRFKGFTDPWEQRKLGELVEIGDIDHRMPETVADGIPYLMTGDFVGTNELNFDGTKMISEEDYCQLSQKIKPEKGDILFARYASVGAARYVDFTRKFLISYSCAIIKKSKKINSKYLYHFITSGKVQQQIKLEINTGSQANIGIDSMKNHIVVSMPPLEEQTKIADALSNLDHLITLHQRKYEKLVNIKKSMLDKMFPKNGASVPEIRFKGFTDLWEQRKLGEIAKAVVRNDPASDAPIMMITAGNGFIEQSDRYAFNNAGESLKKYILLECGELAYNHGASKLRPYGSCFALTTVEKARIPFVYHCFSVEKSNPEFLSIELNGANVENQLRKIVSSGARMDGLLNIAYSEYTEVTVQLPKKEEQDWIAKFFKHLDTLITLHQRKLEKLQNIKKSCLEKMFV